MAEGDDPLVAKLRTLGDNQIERVAKIIKGEVMFENSTEDIRSFSLIIKCGFGDDPLLCQHVVDFLKSQATQIPQEFFSSVELEALFAEGSQTYRWMEKELELNKATVFQPWSALVKSARQPIPINLLNKLLAIMEKCFKHQDQSVRAGTYKCWTVLMDNFALDPNMLCSKKRIVLITLPLCVSVRALPEDQCALRFDAWWHFMGLFKERLPLHFKEVVLPFLQFYFVPSEIKATRAGRSPAKQYSRINLIALEAMAVLICGLDSVKISKVDLSTIHNCLRNGKGILSVKTYIENHQSIIKILCEAISLLQFSKTELAYVNAILQELGALSMEVCLQTDENCKTVMTEFLKFCLETINKTLPNPHGVPIIIEILDVVSKMQTDVLTSSKMIENSNKDWVAVTMIRQMLTTGLTTRVAFMTDPERNAYNAIFERYVSQLQKCRVGGIEGFNISANCLMQTNLSPEQLAVLWKTLSSNFERFIDRYKEICQKDKDGNLDFSTVELMLVFPFVKFLNTTSRHTWNQWGKLFKQVIDTAETLPVYKSLSIENYLATSVGNLCVRKFIVAEHFNLCIYLSESLVASVKSICNENALSQDLILKPPSSILKLLKYLAQGILDFTKSKSSTFGNVYRSLCNQIITLLEISSKPEVMFDVYLHLCPAIVALIDNSLLSTLKNDHQAAGLSLFDRVINSIQARYEGPFDEKLLEVLKPFLISGLMHAKSKISSRCRDLWNITFATQLTEVPIEISDCLKSSSSLLESSLSMDFSQTTNSPTTFRSFFNRVQNISESGNPMKSPGQNSNKSPKRKVATVSIEDENSSNFVVISPSTKKRRPLTEHQKEKLLSRNDSVPALYSELSRDEVDLSLLHPLFDSQQSTDGSLLVPEKNSSSGESENHIDTVEADLKENKVGSADKRKQAVPHKFVAPLRTRSRKRTFDEANKDVQDSSKSGRPHQHKNPDKSHLKISNNISPVSNTTKEPTDFQEACSPTEVSKNEHSVLMNAVTESVSEKRLVVRIEDFMESPLSLKSEVNPKCVVAKKLAFEQMMDESVTLEDPTTESSISKEEEFIGNSQTLDALRPSKRLRTEKSRFEDPTESDANKTLTPAQNSRQKRIRVNQFGETKLHISVRRDKLDDVKMLLDSSVDVNQGDNFGWTPLHEAFVPQQHGFTIVKLLIANGANVNAQASDGSTPLHAALNQGSPQEIISFLLENGADPSIKNNSGISPEERAPALFQKPEMTVLNSKAEEADQKDCQVLPVCTEPSAKDEPTAKDTQQENLCSAISTETIRTPLPFSRGLTPPSGSPLSHISRGEKMISLSKTKSFESSLPAISSVSDLMSPKPDVIPSNDYVAMTPKQDKPWLRYEPSPMDKMPSVSILKDKLSSADKPEEKKGRRVQFTNPIVSDEVWFEKPGSGTSTRQRQAVRPGLIHRINFEANSSIGSYEMSQDFLTPNYIYPSLVDCDEDVATVMHNLTDSRWYKLLSECLKKNNIHKISDLSKLTRTKALALQGIKPPGNVQSIKNALRIFEKSWKRKMSNSKKAPISCNDLTADKTKKTGLASIVDETSPEEEHETMDLIYNRPSPPPTDDLSKLLEKENDCDVEIPNSPSKTPDLNNLEKDPEIGDHLVPTHEVSSELGSDSQPQEISEDKSNPIEDPAVVSPEKKALKRVKKVVIRKSKKKQKKMGSKALKTPTKKIGQKISNSSVEAPVNMDAEPTCSNEKANPETLPCHEQYQGISAIEPEIQESSTQQPIDLLNQASEHIGVIESAYESISKLVPGLGFDDTQTIQYLRLNLSNQIQKAAVILAELSKSS